MSCEKIIEIAYDIYFWLIVIVKCLGYLAFWMAIGILIMAFLSASVYSNFMYGQNVFWQTFYNMIFDGRVIMSGLFFGFGFYAVIQEVCKRR